MAFGKLRKGKEHDPKASVASESHVRVQDRGMRWLEGEKRGKGNLGRRMCEEIIQVREIK